jgi:magnesium-transporting ATPase (P-type)
MTKGADSVILERLRTGQDTLTSTTIKFISEFAEEGLRTLLLAQKEIDPDHYEKWNKEYQ